MRTILKILRNLSTSIHVSFFICRKRSFHNSPHCSTSSDVKNIMPVDSSASTTTATRCDVVLGVNYEGGRVLDHALALPGCIGAVNAQIAMDAPFAGHVAHEGVRSQGRSEAQFEGYDEAALVRSLAQLFGAVREQMTDAKAAGDGRQQPLALVIQIARGRSGRGFYDEVVAPALQGGFEAEQSCAMAVTHLETAGKGEPPSGKLPALPPSSGSDKVLPVVVKYGYRTTEYFRGFHGNKKEALPSQEEKENEEETATEFFFVNIGMFARLGVATATLTAAVDGSQQRLDVNSVATEQLALPAVGSLLQPMWAVDVEYATETVGKATGGLSRVEYRTIDASRCAAFAEAAPCRLWLAGLGDRMPFVTPEHYDEQQLLALFKD